MDGPTGTGKTALVRWVLLRRGFDYVNAQGRKVYQIVLELAQLVTGRQLRCSTSQLLEMIRGARGQRTVIDEVDRC